jgi:hypothetical protein
MVLYFIFPFTYTNHRYTNDNIKSLDAEIKGKMQELSSKRKRIGADMDDLESGI